MRKTVVFILYSIFFFRWPRTPRQSLAVFVRKHLAGILAASLDEGDPATAYECGGAGPDDPVHCADHHLLRSGQRLEIHTNGQLGQEC